MSGFSSSDEITLLLRRVSSGDREAEETLIPIVYRDLRRLAASFLRRERPDHTLQPTALVHETYLRLVGDDEVQFQDRSHFFRLAATVMRRILVDYARRRKAEKRGGGAILPVENLFSTLPIQSELVLDLDQALNRLATLDPRQSKVVEMRFFGGLSEEEIASVLGVSSRTVKREWTMAKAWLRGELTDSR